MTTLSTLTPEQVNALTKDWFQNRDSKTFVLIPKERELAWTIESNHPFIDSHTDFKHLLTGAFDLLQRYIDGLCIPTRVYIRLDKTRSMTDGKNIYVATEVFDDTTYPTESAVDVFLGLGAHEGLHVLYTDFKDYPQVSKSGSKEEKIREKVIQSIANIYEDERIERLGVEHRPGIAPFLERTKYYYFEVMKKQMEEKAKSKPPEPESVFSKIMNCLLDVIRYPKNLTQENIEFFSTYLHDIKEVLTPYPTTTKEVKIASEKTFDIIKDLIKEELEKAAKESEEESGGEGEGSPGGSLRELTEEEVMEAIGKMMEASIEEIKDLIEKSFEHGGHLEESEKSKKLTHKIVGVLEGDFAVSHDGHFINQAESNPEEYKKSMSRVSRYISAIRKQLKYHDKDYKIVHKSLRSGYLDTNKLSEAAQGVQNVYEGHGIVKTDKVAMCFLIDESGSMSGRSIQAARDTAILLYEAIKVNQSVEIYIYGHTADLKENGKVDLTVYVEPGMSLAKTKYALGSIEAQCQNRDGSAILLCAERVRSKTSRKCLMFVLSDGQPNAYHYSGDSAIRDTREKVTKAQRLGFEIVQIAINHTYDPKRMFDSHIILDDLSSLPRDLGSFVKSALLKKQKIQTT